MTSRRGAQQHEPERPRPAVGLPYPLSRGAAAPKETAVLFGISTFATDYSIGPAELAREAEARGFDSIWLAEHTHIPLSQRTSPDGAPLPQHYWHSLDPFLALTAAAAATTTIKLAFGVCLVIERDTITTAKEVATLDLLSGG